ncbi:MULTISPECIES: hypothetical protein [Sphingomonas]|uniref:Uncharacterized protein n=2 Tax=Sphingomonas paucimobilis TaxID=13689 RepID=A0A411LHG5_SPHPI|nr:MULTISPECIES: hypothetical protein [Sphingomonas]MBQ1481102.1 hypothetical protein [Sphingomonas sp.]NNG58857.1 hypothetical protein [Sphingomonas paucimobilis]QBE91795.1 hypothetical protein DRN02_007015 [Sphingomonas paucimobilis]QPS16869.1 hypothetical protein I6G65_04275 [Sphingomonas paucimobilis]QPT08343.1 hypothetical protein I6G38_16670 [Sphingomonas paucimobilis]
MTQLRAPRTYPDAITRIAGAIGWEEVCRITGRALRSARYWSQTNCKTVPSIAQAQALDAAYIAAGGQGSPFFDAFEFQLGIQIERQEACTRELLGEIAVASKEFGEAMAAAIRITQSNASPLDVHRALAEVEQSAGAIDALMRRLTSFLPSMATDAGKDGGNHQ